MRANETNNTYTVLDAIGYQLNEMAEAYSGMHGYASLVICLLGVASNLCNIVVLTRKEMLSPTNQLLTALAVADLLTMVVYIPYAVYFYCVTEHEKTTNYSFFAALYYLFNHNFTITTHTIAMWLTVALAVVRYIAVCHHSLGVRVCKLRVSCMTSVSIYAVTPLVCLPNYLMCRIKLNNQTDGYWYAFNGFVTPAYKSVNYWLFGVFLKVAPCLLLTVLSVLLLSHMRVAQRNRRQLLKQRRGVDAHHNTEHMRTTTMLVTVVLCFVCTELPQGIIALMSGIDPSVFKNIYQPLGDVWDLLGLLNSAVNFVLYCTMSRQFRRSFVNIFCFKSIHNRQSLVSELSLDRRRLQKISNLI